MKKCIVNFVSNALWYPKGQDRLLKSLKSVNYGGDFLTWRGDKQFYEATGCPPHKRAPYAFKPYALMEAKKRGYDVAVWLDASFWAIKELAHMFQFINKKGWMMQSGAGNVGQWCADSALKPLGITREEAFDIPLFTAGGTGLNFRNETACKFLDQWYEKANDGISFHGSWTNRNNEVSQHPKVRGHRHDMTAGSVIATKLGMDYIGMSKGQPFFAYYQWWLQYKDDPTHDTSKICLLLAGM